ncbi:ABC transporter ATP-binding protein [Magnetococcales bacterium HHB-1]
MTNISSDSSSDLSDKNSSLLRLQNIDAAYGPVQALRSVSLHVNAGEIVTLIGANGAGKSTLLMTIFASPEAKQGEIIFNGQKITHQATHHIARSGIALVPEGRRIFPSMSVEENLYLGGIPLEQKEKDLKALLKRRLEKNYTLFPRLAERRKQRAGTLSGGEQQMLAIARALMSAPILLLLDEPSLGLAPLMVRMIFSTLKEISNQGTTIFLVEQNANQALKLAHRGYVLMNGEIRMQGEGETLLQNPEVRKAYLGGH